MTEDFYQRQIDMDGYLGKPYPIDPARLARAVASARAFDATCWNCGDPTDDGETALCDDCAEDGAE